jgi:hypothetical protein
MYGEATVQGKGVRGATVEDRRRTFFTGVCDDPVIFETFAEGEGRLATRIHQIIAGIAARPCSITFVHFPAGDAAAGASVDAMLDLYRQIVDQCAAHDTVCIIGGQQPVNAFDDETTLRQIEIERRAAQTFGAAYVPTYKYMRSESSRRRLMIRIDSGDGQFVDDYGHELLFALYRNRLLELTGSTR